MSNRDYMTLDGFDYWGKAVLLRVDINSPIDPKTKKISSGLIQEGRLTEIQTDIAAGEMMELEKLVKTDRMYEHYNWGWSLVHFLMSEPKYQRKFQKFVIFAHIVLCPLSCAPCHCSHRIITGVASATCHVDQKARQRDDRVLQSRRVDRDHLRTKLTVYSA